MTEETGSSNAPWLKEKADALKRVEEALDLLEKEDFEVGSNLHNAFAAVDEAHAILKRRWM